MCHTFSLSIKQPSPQFYYLSDCNSLLFLFATFSLSSSSPSTPLMWGKPFFWRRIIYTNNVQVSVFCHDCGFFLETLQTAPWRAPWILCFREPTPSPCSSEGLWSIFVTIFRPRETQCKSIVPGAELWNHHPWYLCVPTPTFSVCNSGVTMEQKGFSQAVPKMQALFQFFIISALCHFILMCIIYGILKVFFLFFLIHWPKWIRWQYNCIGF